MLCFYGVWVYEGHYISGILSHGLCKEATRTHYPTKERIQDSYDILRQKNSKNHLEEWVMDFTKGNTREWYFLTTRMNECDKFQPMYTKGEHGYLSLVTITFYVSYQDNSKPCPYWWV